MTKCFECGILKGMGRKKLHKAKVSDVKASMMLSYMKQYYVEKGFQPSYREIMRATGIKSTSMVVYYLNKLEKKGMLKKDIGRKQALAAASVRDIEMRQEENIVPMPLLGNIVAGYPLFSEENKSDVFYVSKNLFGTSQDIFCLTIQGESMLDAGMEDGDIVVVKVQNTAENGDIVAARTEQGTTVKKFYKESNCIRLQPQNVAFMPIIAKEVEILGKVIGIIKRF